MNILLAAGLIDRLKMTALLCMGLFLSTLSASGQPPDSLFAIWEDRMLPKATRFDAVAEICWQLNATDPEEALAYGRAFLLEADDSLSTADAYSAIGNAYHVLDRNDSAVSAFDRAISFSRADRSRNAKHLLNKGAAQMYQGDHSGAIETLLRSARLADEHGMEELALKVYGNLGIVHALRRDHDAAIRYFRNGLRKARMIDDNATAGQFMDNIGTSYSELGLYDSARHYLEQAVDAMQGGPGLAFVQGNLAILYQRLERWDEADELLQRALEAHIEAGRVGDISNTMINLAGSELRRKKYGAAITLCKAALEKAGSVKAVVEVHAACACLSEAYEGLGNHAQALQFYKRMDALDDSLLNKENVERIAGLEARFNFAKQQLADSLKHAAELEQVESERTIAQLRADRNRNRALATGGAAVLLLLGGGAWFITDRRRRQERFEKEAATLETQALRSQMNPHFIFNALNSINAFVQQNDPDNATSFLTKFARVMRSVLENSRHSEVPLQDDLDTLRGYMDLERKRMGGAFDFSIEVDPAIDPEEVMVPPLVVQPFVENAIWHGMKGRRDKGHITLRVKKEGKQLVWQIEDDGVGRQTKKEPDTGPAPGQTVKKSSLGTAITRSRLDLVQKQHGGNAGFRYEDLPQGTRVIVEMPLLVG